MPLTSASFPMSSTADFHTKQHQFDNCKYLIRISNSRSIISPYREHGVLDQPPNALRASGSTSGLDTDTELPGRYASPSSATARVGRSVAPGSEDAASSSSEIASPAPRAGDAARFIAGHFSAKAQGSASAGLDGSAPTSPPSNSNRISHVRGCGVFLATVATRRGSAGRATLRSITFRVATPAPRLLPAL
jgi:hypothetical protein